MMKKYVLIVLSCIFTFNLSAQLPEKLQTLEEKLTALLNAFKTPSTGVPPAPPPPPTSLCPTILSKPVFEFKAFNPDTLESEEKMKSDEYVLSLLSGLTKPVSKKVETLEREREEKFKKLYSREAFNAGFRFAESGVETTTSLLAIKKNITNLLDVYTREFKKEDREDYATYLERMKLKLTNLTTLLDAYKPFVYNFDTFKDKASQELTQSAINIIAAHRQEQKVDDYGVNSIEAINSDSLFTKAFTTSDTLSDLENALQLLRINKDYLRFAQLEYDLAHPSLKAGVKVNITEDDTIFQLINVLGNFSWDAVRNAKDFLKKYLFSLQMPKTNSKFDAIKREVQKNQQKIGVSTPKVGKKQVAAWSEVIPQMASFEDVFVLIRELHNNIDTIKQKETDDLVITIKPRGQKFNKNYRFELPPEAKRDSLINFIKKWKPILFATPYDQGKVQNFVCEFNSLITNLFPEQKPELVTNRINELASDYLQQLNHEVQFENFVINSSSSKDLYDKMITVVPLPEKWTNIISLLANPYRTSFNLSNLLQELFLNETIVKNIKNRLSKFIEPFGQLMLLLNYYKDLIEYKTKSKSPEWQKVLTDIIRDLQEINTKNTILSINIPQAIGGGGVMQKRLSEIKTSWGKEEYTGKLSQLIAVLQKRDILGFAQEVQRIVYPQIPQLQENLKKELEKITIALTLAVLYELQWELEQLNKGNIDVIPGLSTEDNNLGLRNRIVYSTLINTLDSAVVAIKEIVGHKKVTINLVNKLEEKLTQAMLVVSGKISSQNIDPDAVMPAIKEYFDQKIELLKKLVK